MVKTLFTLTISSALLVLASFAGPAPNLEKTLAVQYELIDQHPYDAEAHNDLGNLLLLMGRDTEAEQAYRRAVELEPRSTAARFNLAVLLQQESRNEEAVRELEALLEIDAYHGWAHYQLGMLYHLKRDRSRALEAYARAFAYDPALTFAINNPHIIDNELSTEALILSQRYRTSAATRVPRHYSNPQRIAELMLEEARAEAEAIEAADEEGGEDLPETGDPEGGAGRDEPRLPARSNTPGLPRGGGSEEDPGRTPPRRGDDSEDDENIAGSAQPGTPLVATPDNRVLTTESVREAGRLNQAAPPPPARPGSAEARRQAFEQRFLAGRSRGSRNAPDRQAAPRDSATGGSATRDETNRRAVTPPPPTRTGRGTPRYRPGSASSGRLEFELLPAEPAERHAALGPSRG